MSEFYPDYPEDSLEFNDLGWYIPKTLSMEVTFNDVDPDVLGLLTGGLMGTPKSADPTFAIELVRFIPVRRRAWRVVWEWLTRKPREHTQQHIYIPHATVSRNPSTTESEQT